MHQTRVAIGSKHLFLKSKWQTREIVAVGNGSHNGLDSFTDTSSHPLYYGRALVIVRRTGGSGLPLKLTASAPSVRPASVTFSRK